MEDTATIVLLENVSSVRIRITYPASGDDRQTLYLEPGAKFPLSDGIQIPAAVAHAAMEIACAYHPSPAESEVLELTHCPHPKWEGLTSFSYRSTLVGHTPDEFKPVEAFPVSDKTHVRLLLFHNCDGVVIVGTADL